MQEHRKISCVVEKIFSIFFKSCKAVQRAQMDEKTRVNKVEQRHPKKKMEVAAVSFIPSWNLFVRTYYYSPFLFRFA